MSGAGGETFVTEIKVRFGDVDHAQIVYYPRYFHFFHVAFEDLFADAFGSTYQQVVIDEHVGFPAVHVECDYRAPSRFGDVLRMEITCVRIGTRSMTLKYRAVRAADLVECAVGKITTACVDMRTFTAMDIPPRYRAFFTRYLEV